MKVALSPLIPAVLLALAVGACVSLPAQVAAPGTVALTCANAPGVFTVELSDRYQMTPVGVGIQLFTGSPASHIDFVTCDGRLYGATPFGVRARTRDPTFWSRRYTFRPPDPVTAEAFAVSQAGRPYDPGVFAAHLTRIRGLAIKGAWGCSEFVQAVALAGGLDLTGRSPALTAPADLRRALATTKVSAR